MIIQSAGATTEKGSIESYDKHVFELDGDEGDKFTIEYKVTSGSYTDLYIMTVSEFHGNYSDRVDFTASFQREKTHKVDDSWTQPDGKDYMLVIDNTDNGHENDAVPNGTISYEIDVQKDAGNMRNMIIIGGLIVIGACLYFLIKRSKEKEKVRHVDFSTWE